MLLMLFVLMYHFDIKGNTANRDYSYQISLLVLVIVSGLRFRIGGDTVNYLYNYHHLIPRLWELSASSFDEIGYEPFFLLFMSSVKSLGVPFFVFQLLHALFVNGLIFHYIKRHSSYPFACVLLYFLWMYPMYNFEEMRASMSVAICLFANDCMVDKKIVKGFFLYAVALLFHYSTAVIVLTPLLLFLRMNLWGLVFLLFSFYLGYFIQRNFGDYLLFFDFNDMVSEKATNYTESDVYFEQNISVKEIIIWKMPYVLFSFIAFWYLRMKKISDDIQEGSLIRLQPYLLIGLVFVLFSIPMPICYRFIRFYIIYFILFFVQFLIGMVRYRSKISISVALIRSFIFFLPMLHIISSIYLDSIYESTNYSKYFCYEKYYPYSSVIERGINERREKLYQKLSSVKFGMTPKEDEF